MLSVILDKNSFLIVMLSVIVLSVILDKNPFLIVILSAIMLSVVAPLQL